MDAITNSFPATNFTLLAVVLALPALGAFVNGIFGKRLGKDGVRLMALAAIGGAFFFSLVTFLTLVSMGGGAEEKAAHLSWTAYRWFSVTGSVGRVVPIDVAFSVDGMSATMMLVITGIGFLIHLYSTEYMAKDEGFHRFFAYLNLFCFAMLVLVMADNMAVLFVGWEGVGLCSYLLIGFWFDAEKNASAGKKAFLVNRIGDFGLILAAAMLIYYCGSLQWRGIEGSAGGLLQTVRIWPIGNLPIASQWDAAHSPWPAWLAHLLLPTSEIRVYASTLVGLAIFLGCAGKSAQIPLYVWLPDAMAGPTPVSALIHAATMVTAGVYLVARMSAVFLLSPAAMAVVAVVGALTAIFAASMGLFQTDLKKVLAYSTVSQLGFMFIGVGVGAFSAGFFHVFTHAFFKACLFLGAGSVIFAMHKRIHDTDRSQDMRNMGGLHRYMPITHATFLIACLAIAGCPPFAGFWSKDEILWQAFSLDREAPSVSSTTPMFTWPTWLGPAIYWVGIVAATMTAFYMFRAYFMTFLGRFKGWTIVKGWKEPKAHHGHDDHAHDDHHDDGPLEGPEPTESPLAITVPLMILAAFAAFGGFLNADFIHVTPLGHVFEPVFKNTERFLSVREAAKGLALPMMAPGLAAFLGGTGLAVWMYWNRGGVPEQTFAGTYPRFYKLLVDKWRVDELYDATVVGMVDALADIFVMADRWIIDGVIAKLTAALVGFTGTVLRAFQTGRVQVYSAAMVIGMGAVTWFVMVPHASVTVDDRQLRETGDVTLSATPGLGYTYRWDYPGASGRQPSEFAPTSELKLRLGEGEKEDVTLFVKNAFGKVMSETVPLSRPGSGKLPFDPAAILAPKPSGIPSGRIPADKIPDIIRGKGL